MLTTVSRYLPIPLSVSDWFEPKEIINFDSTESGLIWTRKKSKKTIVGSWAGHLRTNTKGRKEWLVRFDDKLYRVSRIVYFLAHTVDPGPLQVDHIDLNTLNNNIDNLRLLDASGQGHNRRASKTNKSGALGVSWFDRDKCWVVHLTHEGKTFCVGRYGCKIEAALAYNKSVLTHCPDFYNVKYNNLSTLTCTCSRCYYKENLGPSFRGVS